MGYGTVCCSPNTDDRPNSCARDAQFDIVNYVTTRGWLNGNNENDGAVLKVRRQAQTSNGFGIPVPYGDIASRPCQSRPFQWYGFPSQNQDSDGCSANWQGRFRYSATSQRPDPCPGDNTGSRIQLTGSSCGGMSGGPLYNRVDDYVIGILKASSRGCGDGQSIVQFSQLNFGRGSGGVDINALRDAIP